MKRIILSAMVLAFAVAVQAGDTKTAQDKDMPACCGSKVKTSVQAKEEPSPAAKGCCGCCKQKSPAKQTAAKQPVLMSPKAMSLASK